MQKQWGVAGACTYCHEAFDLILCKPTWTLEPGCDAEALPMSAFGAKMVVAKARRPWAV